MAAANERTLVIVKIETAKGVANADAILGVQDRFADTEETNSRIVLAATVLPPVALLTLPYPMAGTGTGSQQNAATALNVLTKWPAASGPTWTQQGCPSTCAAMDSKIGPSVAYGGTRQAS